MGTAADRIDTLREDRIPGSAEISVADENALLEFSDELFLRKSEYSDHRHEKLLRHCVRMAEKTDSDLVNVLKERAVAEDAVCPVWSGAVFPMPIYGLYSIYP